MWQLKVTTEAGDWETVDEYATVVEAARRIVELEGYPVTGVLFDVMVETRPEIADDSLSHLEHTGRSTRRLYVVKQLRH